MPRVLLSEWTKLRSVRSTAWSLAVAVVFTIGIAALASGIVAHHWPQMHPRDKADFNPLDVSLAGVQLAQLAIGVLGVLVITAEYSTGMIRSSMTAAPRRLPVLWAKAIVYALVTLALLTPAAVAAFFTAQAILSRRGISYAFAHPGVPRVVLGAGLYLAVVGIFGLGLGAIVRNTAGGIATFAGIMFVLPPLMNVLPASWNAAASPYLPLQAGEALLALHRGNQLAPWTGFGDPLRVRRRVARDRRGAAPAPRRLAADASAAAGPPATIRGMTEENRTSRVLADISALASAAAGAASERLTVVLGGAERKRVIVVLACVLGLSGADAATVGASATELRAGLHISNTDIGLLVAVTSLVGAVGTLPFGVLADRVRRTWTLGGAIVLWGAAMLWSAAVSDFHELLLARLFLGAVTAAAGPLVASLVGDYFGSWERGKIYGFILSGELLGAGIGFGVTGDIAALSWRAAFVILALPAFALAWLVVRLPEPERGGRGVLAHASEAPPPANADVPHETDAQRLARERGLEADPRLVLDGDPARMNLIAAVRYVLRIRTNIILIAASACGYYFLAGVQTFGAEFAKEQYSINQALANLLLLVIGTGAIGGVLAGGNVGDALLRRGRLNGRVVTPAVAAALTTILFVPALFTRSVVTAVPYLMAAVFMLSAQNPPLDAARLDIMPPLLWGRAESVRTLLRSLAQALAPLLFGVVSDHVFGGGRSGLQWTFVVMLVPLGASAWLLFKARRTYPADVAAAAAAPRPRPRPVPAAASEA